MYYPFLSHQYLSTIPGCRCWHRQQSSVTSAVNLPAQNAVRLTAIASSEWVATSLHQLRPEFGRIKSFETCLV